MQMLRSYSNVHFGETALQRPANPQKAAKGRETLGRRASIGGDQGHEVKGGPIANTEVIWEQCPGEAGAWAVCTRCGHRTRCNQLTY